MVASVLQHIYNQLSSRPSNCARQTKPSGTLNPHDFALWRFPVDSICHMSGAACQGYRRRNKN